MTRIILLKVASLLLQAMEYGMMEQYEADDTSSGINGSGSIVEGGSRRSHSLTFTNVTKVGGTTMLGTHSGQMEIT
uniref:Uncharacterized protein n=1 Tax=Nelumbo nucifera TaxID=4432 RepID=A0A822ZGN9_NELNU|nr:TPA_asm: hypothetical protein HUJ06_001051 [Nelumbo nucifera]